MGVAEVGIIMGSDSDLPIMKDAIEICEALGIGYEVNIVSAHRTPSWMVQYSQQAQERGIKIIIAGAGGAAHLPGMVASLTLLPVIGVPIKTRTMNGIDSLYSIVQMPSGVPVSTVAIGGAKNAGLLAAQMLSLQNADLAEKVTRFRQEMESLVLNKNKKLQEIGYRNYLKSME